LLLLIAFSPIFARAQASLGGNAAQLYQKGMNTLIGSRMSRSTANALDYFRRSAELGYAPAQVVLGYFYETGEVTPQEPAQAMEWYKKAARQDDPLGQWLAGRLIYAGVVPPRDLNEAAKWLQKSANHEDPFAEYLLGKIQLERSDYAGAAECLRKAADQGLPQAQRQLGLLYLEGRGVSADKFEAYVWLLVSAASGNPVADDELQRLEAELGSTQVEQAKMKARALEESANRNAQAHGCTGWLGEFDVNLAPPPPEIQRFCR